MKLCKAYGSLLLVFVWVDVPAAGFAPLPSTRGNRGRPFGYHDQRSQGVAPRLTTTHGDNTESDNNQVLQLERKVSTLFGRLKREERRSTESRNQWMRERTQLVHKISVLTTLLAKYSKREEEEQQQQEQQALVDALELQLKMSRENEEEILQEQERLEREVKILQNQIVQIRNLYKTEQYITEDLEGRLETSEREREEERMEWQRMVEAQKRHIESLKMHVETLEYQQQTARQPTITSNTCAGRNETMVPA